MTDLLQHYVQQNCKEFVTEQSRILSLCVTDRF